MLLFDLGLADVELPRLAVVVGERLRAHALLGAADLFGVAFEPNLGVFTRAAIVAPAVRLIVHTTLWVVHRHMAVLLKMVERAFRRVDRNMGEVRPAKAFDLRVEVREVPPLQQRVIRVVDPAHDILRAKGHLLGLGKKVVDVGIQRQRANDAHRHLFFGDQLGRVEDVELKVIGKVVIKDLNAQIPLRVIARVDGIPHVAAVEIRVRAVDLERFVPDHRLNALLWLPMELNVMGFALGIDQPEGVHAKAFHEAEGTWDRPVRHLPNRHVDRFG